MKIFYKILDFIAPKKCYSCKKEWHFICQECFKKEQNHREICFVCKKNSLKFNLCQECRKKVYYDKVIICKYYNNTLTWQLIKEAKFFWKREILIELWEYIKEIFFKNYNIFDKKDYIITFIPSHWLRKIKRGFNQGEYISKSFSEAINIEFRKNILKKIKNTRQQSKLSKIERELNLKDSFIINDKVKEEIIGKKIIIIDDVISTGSTLNEVSKLLKNFWAKEVIWIAIASGSNIDK